MPSQHPVNTHYFSWTLYEVRAELWQALSWLNIILSVWIYTFSKVHVSLSAAWVSKEIRRGGGAIFQYSSCVSAGWWDQQQTQHLHLCVLMYAGKSQQVLTGTSCAKPKYISNRCICGINETKSFKMPWLRYDRGESWLSQNLLPKSNIYFCLIIFILSTPWLLIESYQQFLSFHLSREISQLQL